MDDTELISLLNQLEEESIGSEGSEIQQDREAALDYYLGNPVGRLAPPTEPDRTQVVSRDLLEAVEWTVPELLRVFLSGDAVEFMPLTQQDVPLARQETAAVNHVILQLNPGYLILNTWFRDALIERNGYVTVFWDEREEKRFEKYANLSDEQLGFLLGNIGARRESVEVLKHERDEERGLNTVELEVTSSVARCRIENVPPEHMRVGDGAKFSLQESGYVGQVFNPTRSELREMGVDEEDIESIPRWYEYDSNDEMRNIIGHENRPATQDVLTSDKSTEKVRAVRAFVRIDEDGDGRAELMEYLHTREKILKRRKATVIPYAHLTPIIRSHRHVGLGFHDLLGDIQEISTFLSRQLLDNIFSSNHNEVVVNAMATGEFFNDFVVRRPGGVMRVQGRPADHVLFSQPQMISRELIPVMQFYEDRREARTGIGRTSQGLDSDVLEKTTASAYQRGLSAASALREGIARTFAETGVKDLMLIVHRTMIENQDHEQIFRLQGLPAEAAYDPEARQQAIEQGLWIPVDPRHWLHRSDMTVKVGLGHSSKAEELGFLGGIAQFQAQAATAGLRVMTEENAFNLGEDWVRAAGFTNRSERYFTNPRKLPQPEPQENPLVTTSKIEQQTQLMKAQMEAQADLFKQAMDQRAEDRRLIAELSVKIAEIQATTGVEIGKEQGRRATALLQSATSLTQADKQSEAKAAADTLKGKESAT